MWGDRIFDGQSHASSLERWQNDKEEVRDRNRDAFLATSEGQDILNARCAAMPACEATGAWEASGILVKPATGASEATGAWEATGSGKGKGSRPLPEDSPPPIKTKQLFSIGAPPSGYRGEPATGASAATGASPKHPARRTDSLPPPPIHERKCNDAQP